MEPDSTEVRRTVLSVLENCTNCKHSYELDDARIVDRKGNLWVLTVTCSHCRTQAFVAAVVGDTLDDPELQVDSVASRPEAPSREPVTVDDVLDVHEFLEDFNGDFRSLFSGRTR